MINNVKKGHSDLPYTLLFKCQVIIYKAVNISIQSQYCEQLFPVRVNVTQL